MKWIDTTDLRQWANRRNCQETLPELARKLIRATSDSIKSIKFPSGENVSIGGWDGILEVSDETEYLPQGISLWEFGSNADTKGKADEDYEKRSKNPIGFNPAECTYVFVTPRLWTKGDEWIEEKKKDGVWKDIKVINAEILEEWLEIAPTVAAWLAIKHLGKYPSEGIQSTEDFWEEWSSGPKIKLNPEILLGGRKSQIDSLFDLSLSPGIISVQGTSRDEALAFIISSFKNVPDKEEDFFARSIIVDSEDTFRKLSVLKTPLILIPRFEDSGIINRAISNGHCVIVPLGADASDIWRNKIVLPQIDRDSFVKSLSKTGIGEERAEKYSKESTRNVTILRRQLEFVRSVPEWAKPENVREILPALIVGRWDENYEHDKNILANLAGENYEEYSKKLSRWLNSSDSPFVKIGNTWRIASPLDAWTNASKYLTQNDFEILRQSFLNILIEINPAFELEPMKRYMASMYGKEREFSGWIREGITQSLILVSIFGNQLKFNLPISGPLWVDRIIAELFNNDNPQLWKSIENKLPLLAEASPNEFLNAIEKYIDADNSPVRSLFNEDPGFMSSQSYHTGLLWALENLAWLPEYFPRATLILAKLSAIDPGGSLANRPINSLAEIFKPWHYQTNATFEDRIGVLKLILQREKEVAWTLLLRMLPDSHAIGHFTHKMRWRTFDQTFEKIYTDIEIWGTHSVVVDLLLSICDFSESEISDLIKKSVNLRTDDRDKILSFVKNNIDKIKPADLSLWQAIRGILNHHRSHPGMHWALQEGELIRYEEIYKALEPADEVQQILWLFEEHWPSFIEGYQRKVTSTESQQKLINDRRIEALKIIYQKYGINRIKEISTAIKDSWILGDTLAYITNDTDEIISICEFLDISKNNLRFIYAFIIRKEILNDTLWIREHFAILKQKGFNDAALSQFLIPVNQNKAHWEFIDSTSDEIKIEYWLNMSPHFWNIPKEEKIIGIRYLLEFKRYFSAIDICSHFHEEIPSDLIAEVLDKAATDKASENTRLNGYEVEQLFETLDKRNDTSPQTLIKLEWYFLPMLASYGNRRSPKLLHNELANNPDFFIEVFKWIYKAENEEEIEETELSHEQIQNRSRQAYELLHSWKQIPGVDEKFNINEEFLWSWINKVREFANNYSKLNIADAYIAQVLAYYPETEEIWPPVEICNVLEIINTDSIKRNFSAAIFNKRGTTSRGVFDGGEQERVLARHFRKLTELHKNRFPNVASVFDSLSKGYEEDAKREDEQAERDRLEY
ncbi:hypothetical protein MM213_12575 [Belliella sp. R4-6]|uniref:Uncharacterized protein n=1 Tax=Belliella alkalica TaxID=1730871 RepID=A0ABS9VEE4_9BACT|nr:hypothetical protein [Belliella alkalica]MCH7414325.1 hypothetical protein [Belliella alkalica]